MHKHEFKNIWVVENVLGGEKKKKNNSSKTKMLGSS